MTKRYAAMTAIAAALLLTGSAILFSKKANKATDSKMLPVALHVLRLSDGWGYEVLVDNKVYIHQDCIPAIPSFKRFASESDALSVGNRVVDKIKQGHKPIITLEDISAAHIRY
jgi:hypothetical protein